MHILRITLHNFRSFRQQGELPQSFSPGTNAIVGRNGSGKSNWLQAVQFCLGLGPYAVLRQEERQAILHEGSGRAAVHAFVEVVLDNSQHRLAVASSTVTIRRTIGWKKDEFFLQRQRCTKQEITSLLEGAGFSKQNPYYIVQQGKVQALCTMSDVERLKLLQGVAGTVLYDEKKRDSVSQMHDNQSRLDQVEGLLQEMQDKLSELESEKQELQAYQKYDRQRRALSYALYEKECHKARKQLAQIEEERQTHLTETLQKLHQKAKALHDEITNTETSTLPVSHAAAKRWSQQAQRLRKQAAAQKTTLLQRQEKLRSAQRQLQQQDEERKVNQAEAAQLQDKLQAAQSDLEKIQPELKDAQQALSTLQQERTQVEEAIQGLYAKQGRAQQFETVAERDAFLQTQINALQKQIASKERLLAKQRQTVEQHAQNIGKEKDTQVKIEAQLSQKSKHLAELSKALTTNQEQKLKLQAARAAGWSQVELAKTELRQSQDACKAAQSLSRQSTPRATALGLQSLPKLVQQLGLSDQQYFGSVLENFTLQHDKYQTCVEMAAQNALFHVIVDCDETASKLVRALEKDQAGRVTFLPLSQLRPEHSDAQIASDDVRPLLSTCLQYDPAVDIAMQHVFGSKWLARTADIASSVCQRHHVDVLTLEGDLCGRKGAMTGGYVDSQKSRIAAHRQVKATQTNLDNAREALQTAEESVRSAQDEWQACNQNVTRQTTQQKQLQHQKEQLQAQLEACEAQQVALTAEEEQVTVSLGQEQETLQTNQAEVTRLKSELGTPLDTNLSADDETLLQTSKKRLGEISQQELPKAQSVVSRLSLHEQKYRLAQKRLTEQLEQLSGRRSNDDYEDGDEPMDAEALLELEQAVEEAKLLQDNADGEFNAAQKSLTEAKQKYTAAKQELDELKLKDESVAKALEEAREKAERLLNKRSMCISNRETYMRKIQELGSLPPPGELEKYADKTISELMKTLENVNKKLKNYSHVNKKAFDQYVNFSEQREQLLKRKEELDQGAAKVKELIDSLDRQKDEAINRTFRGVSNNFRDVFKELVPNGAGELIMRTDMDADEEPNTDGEDGSVETPKKKDPSNPDVSLYRGIGIKVRFSAVGENYMMSQLSGGQKALVALALIFAIQRCDPAPFYMFDELDQALDSTYRAAVANVIQRQANDKENPTQFIVTTFRPELVSVSNRCYGVSHQNKVSSIHPLSKKDALAFVANLMKDEEAVGDVTSLAASKATRQTASSRKRKSVEQVSPGEDDEEHAEQGSPQAA